MGHERRNTFARGKIDLAKVRCHWAGLLRVVASIYPGTVRAYDRLSPFVSRHLGVHGAYSFQFPALVPDAIRELQNPDVTDDDYD